MHFFTLFSWTIYRAIMKISLNATERDFSSGSVVLLWEIKSQQMDLQAWGRDRSEKHLVKEKKMSFECNPQDRHILKELACKSEVLRRQDRTNILRMMKRCYLGIVNQGISIRNLYYTTDDAPLFFLII